MYETQFGLVNNGGSGTHLFHISTTQLWIREHEPPGPNAKRLILVIQRDVLKTCEDRSGTFRRRSRQGAKALALFILGMNCSMSYVGGNGCNRRHGGYAPTSYQQAPTARSNRWSSRLVLCHVLCPLWSGGGSASDPRPSVMPWLMLGSACASMLPRCIYKLYRHLFL